MMHASRSHGIDRLCMNAWALYRSSDLTSSRRKNFGIQANGEGVASRVTASTGGKEQAFEVELGRCHPYDNRVTIETDNLCRSP